MTIKSLFETAMVGIVTEKKIKTETGKGRENGIETEIGIGTGETETEIAIDAIWVSLESGL